MSDASNNGRFRSQNGVIYSNDQNAFTPRVSTGQARKILNALYDELAKHDKESADKICKQFNA